MADNNQHSANNVDNTQSESFVGDAVIKEIEGVGRMVEEKQTILLRTYRELMVTYGNISAIVRTHLNFLEIIEMENTEDKCRLTEIRKQALHVTTILEDFEGKIDQCNASVQESIDELKKQNANFNKMGLGGNIKTMTEDEERAIANRGLEWLRRMRSTSYHPDVEELADRWDQMQLMSRTAFLLSETQRLFFIAELNGK